MADRSLAREPAVERDTKAIPPAEREHLEILIDNLIDAEAELDDARRSEQAARKCVEDATARRDDLQRQVEAILARTSAPTDTSGATEHV